MKLRAPLLVAAMLLTVTFAAVSSASAATAISPFSVSVTSKKHSKFGASGQLVKSIRIRGAGVRQARPQVSCNPKYCGKWSRARGKTKRSRLFRSPIVFSNVNWVISSGKGFTIKLLPKSKKKLGIYVVMSPPDAQNKRFAISSAGCLRRSGKKTACPPGTRLPTINFKKPGPTIPPYVPGGDLAAVSFGEDKLALLTTSGDGKLWWRQLTGSDSWTDWQYVGGSLASGPSVTSPAPGRLDVVARDAANQVQHITYIEGNGWGAWRSLGGEVTGTPSVSHWAPNRINVFARGLDGTLKQTWSDDLGGNWYIWHSLGECLASSPTTASWAPNRVDVFFRGCTSNELGQKVWDGSAWSNYVNLGGTIGGAPNVFSAAPGHLDVFMPDLNNKVIHRFFDGGAWSTFIALNSPTAGSNVIASALPTASGLTIRSFMRDASGSVIESRWTPALGWGAWTTLWK